MSSPFLYGHQPGTYERQIRSLSDSSDTPRWRVRALFDTELARLQMGAKIGSYLAVLTESNVRGMLRRKAKLAEIAANDKDCKSSAATAATPLRDTSPETDALRNRRD
jgi:hypothetical protein